jgi:sulfonate transport system permease protein
MIRNIPHLALLPLVIVWLGIGEPSKIFLVALGVMFPIYINTLHGIRTVNPGFVEVGKMYGLKGWQLFKQVYLPSALPSIFVGIRYALGVMWLTLIVSETIATNQGIGYLAMNARQFMQTDVIIVSIVIYALFGKLADILTQLGEKYALRWHPNYRKQA